MYCGDTPRDHSVYGLSQWGTTCMVMEVYVLCVLSWRYRDLNQQERVMDHNSNRSWWRHQMETFSALLAICVGNSPVTGEFPAQRPVAWNFDDVFFDLRLNKRLRKQSWGLWFETLSRPLWPHYNEQVEIQHVHTTDGLAPTWSKTLQHHEGVSKYISLCLCLCRGMTKIYCMIPQINLHILRPRGSVLRLSASTTFMMCIYAAPS